MDKSQLKKINDLCKKIESEEGEGSVFNLGSSKSNMNIPRISTNIEDLDYILGGGLPCGRIIEVSGPESSGKTTLGYYLCSLNPYSVYIPVEGTFDSQRAEIMGNDETMIVYRAEYGEQALNKTMQFAKFGVPLIVIDSVPALIPKEEFDNAEKDLSKENRMGGIARLLDRTLPVLQRRCEQSGTIVLFINQVRDNMNAGLFGPKTRTPGGRALKHYCSVRIEVGRRSWIEVPNKDPRNSADTEKVGLVTKFKVEKSKVSNPFGECQIPLFFDRGYVSHDDVDSIRKEIMANNRKKQKELKSSKEDSE